MGGLKNIPLRTFKEYLAYNGLKHIRTTGGHEIWAGKQLKRPIILQSHICPVPEFIVKQCLRALNKDRDDFINFMMS